MIRRGKHTDFGPVGERPRRVVFAGVDGATDIHRLFYATYRYRVGDEERIRHHLCDIIRYLPCGKIAIDTGHGDECSRTTMARFNRFLQKEGYRFYMIDYVPYVERVDGSARTAIESPMLLPDAFLDDDEEEAPRGRATATEVIGE